MAQTGYTPIQLYSSPTPGAAPAASNLTDGELAINVADGKLFYKNTAGVTQVIADSAYSVGVALQGSGTSVVNTGTVQFANSNGVTFGLTGNTMTASVAAGGGNITFSAGTTSIGTNNVVFASSNGVSFGLTSNTVTALPYLNSYAPRNQVPYLGYTANNNVALGDSKYVYPLILDEALVFQRVIGNASANVAAAGATLSLTYATSNSASVAFTAEQAIYHGIYSKTGDTLTSVTSIKYPISYLGSVSFSTSTTAATAASYARSHTVTLTASVATGSASNGLLFSSNTTTYSTTGAANTSATTVAMALALPTAYSANFSAVTGTYQYTAMSSAPITLQPNTYFVVEAVTGGATYATNNITIGSIFATGSFAARDGFSAAGNNSITNFILSGRRLDGAAFQFEDFGPIYQSQVSSVVIDTSTTFYTTYRNSFYQSNSVVGTLAASYASTQFTRSSVAIDTAAPISLLFPNVTYR